MELTGIQQHTAAYIKGELSDTELTDFETALDENEQLQDEVMFQRKLLSALTLRVVKNAVKQAKTDNLVEDKTRHQKLENIHAAMQKARIDNNRQKRIRHWLVAGLAAACVLLISIFGLHQYAVSQQYAKIEHEMEHWQVDFDMSDPGYENVLSTSDIEENIQYARKQYAGGKLAETVATLNLIPEEDTPEHILLTKGKIYAQLKNYKESSRILELIIMSKIVITDMSIGKRDDSEMNEIKDEARLALGVVYLRMGKKKKAKKQLEQIHTISMKKEADRIMKTYF